MFIVLSKSLCEAKIPLYLRFLLCISKYTFLSFIILYFITVGISITENVICSFVIGFITLFVEAVVKSYYRKKGICVSKSLIVLDSFLFYFSLGTKLLLYWFISDFLIVNYYEYYNIAMAVFVIFVLNFNSIYFVKVRNNKIEKKNFKFLFFKYEPEIYSFNNQKYFLGYIYQIKKL